MDGASASTITLVDRSEYPTTLIFSEDNPTDTTITLNGRLFYIVKTRIEIVKKLAREDLQITTDITTASGELVASFEWHSITSDIITWPARGMQREKASRWLKKNFMPFSRNAKFRYVDGRTYRWDKEGHRSQLRLLDEEGGIIAYFERAQPYVNHVPGFNYNPVPKPSQLHLSQQADLMREDVLLSFISLERDIRGAERMESFVATGQAAEGSNNIFMSSNYA